MRAPRSLARAAGDVAVISVPGEYAALEAHKALGAGMDVLLFSDGVAIEDEVALKRRAHDLGLLVMGPGAGTAIIDGARAGLRQRGRPRLGRRCRGRGHRARRRSRCCSTGPARA